MTLILTLFPYTTLFRSSLIGKRYQYVLAAAKFKTSATSVRAPEQFKRIHERTRHRAAQDGLRPDAIERMFSDLVNHFIEEEMQRWKSTHA